MTDDDLIRAATDAVDRGDGDTHSVAAAVLASSGEVDVALNVFHFTGGPCAELSVLGAAAAQGRTDLSAIVAVGDGGRGVLAPCGRCRQVLADLHPGIRVLMPDGSSSTPLELLPGTYRWSEQQG